VGQLLKQKVARADDVRHALCPRVWLIEVRWVAIVIRLAASGSVVAVHLKILWEGDPIFSTRGRSKRVFKVESESGVWPARSIAFNIAFSEQRTAVIVQSFSTVLSVGGDDKIGLLSR
jgi:hypothetical protein